MLAQTKAPELHLDWTTRGHAANVRLYRLAAEIPAAVEAGVFSPRVGWPCQDAGVEAVPAGVLFSELSEAVPTLDRVGRGRLPAGVPSVVGTLAAGFPPGPG